MQSLGISHSKESDPQASRSIFRTELDEVIGITVAKRGGRPFEVCNRRATKPVIPMASLKAGEKGFDLLARCAIFKVKWVNKKVISI